MASVWIMKERLDLFDSKSPTSTVQIEALELCPTWSKPLFTCLRSVPTTVYAQMCLNQFLTVKWNTRKMWQGNSTVIVRHVSRKGGVQSMTSMKYDTKLIQNINTELSFNKWLWDNRISNLPINHWFTLWSVYELSQYVLKSSA